MCKSEIQESLLYPFSCLQYPTHHHALYILLPNWIFNLPLSISNTTKASYYELTPGILELPISLLERERDKKEREPEIGEIFILRNWFIRLQRLASPISALWTGDPKRSQCCSSIQKAYLLAEFLPAWVRPVFSCYLGPLLIG